MNVILITGAMGFIGSNLAISLKHENPDCFIIGIDNLLSSEYLFENINSLDLYISGSIEDDSILNSLNDFNIDTIFHLATYHGNDTSILNPFDTLKHGTITTIKLLEYYKNKNINRFIYSSAGCSMGNENQNKCKYIEESEEVSLKLDTPYQISKITGEFYCNYYYKLFNLPVVRARFQNVYGPGEILGAGRWRGSDATIWRNVIPIFIYKALKNLPLTICGSGQESRDFIFVDDIVDGLIKCAITTDISGDVFNLCIGKQVKIIDLAEMIINKTNSTSIVNYINKREWDSSHQRFASIQKSKKILDFESKIQLDDGLDKTIKWTLDNIKMITQTINKHKRNL